MCHDPSPTRTLKVIILKPGRYGRDGYVERFRRGYMPNATIPHMKSLTPRQIDGCAIEVHTIDEYVQTDLSYLRLFEDSGTPTLLAQVGVQSSQFHRALDLAAYAQSRGTQAIIGGPHVMTCDTDAVHGRGVSIAVSEAETVWGQILSDASHGFLQPLYGHENRWKAELPSESVGLRKPHYSLYPLFNRYQAWQRRHPMSGGVQRVRIDSNADYRDLRRRTYGFELAPLPRCLDLSESDDKLNREAKLVLTRSASV
jgi:hypothetical protein